MSRRILITGITGLLAPYVADAFADVDDIITTSATGGDYPCDLTNEKAVYDLLKRTKSTCICHCAALTNIDGCEKNHAQAYSINQIAVRNIIKFIPVDTLLVYISTDQVYPNTRGLHKEGAEGPVNVYGKSKYAGELEVLKHRNSLILRVNFFGPSKTIGRISLSDYFIEKFKKNEPITLFTDSLFSPLHIKTISEIIVRCVSNKVNGVFNLGCREGLSKHDFAHAVAQHFNYSTENTMAVKSIDIQDRVNRALDLRMNVSLIEKIIGYNMPTIYQEIGKL